MPPNSARLLLALSLCFLSTAASAQETREQREQRLKNLVPPKDTSTETEQKSFKVAEGFEVNLFASDPVIAKPIALNFDAAGRMWVVSSAVYPMVMPGQVADDKVTILEDTTGSGKADKSHVFAAGLLIPTGIEIGDGGAYVSNSTQIVHLKDTDGDGVADQRRVILSGFGTEDTHHIVHGFRWGPDGRLYFDQAVYIHSHVETPNGTVRLLGGGVWRFRPETMQLEVFCRGLVNTWGHSWDRFGQSFGTDGAGGEGIYYEIPGATYTTLLSSERSLHGMNPGSPKYAGLETLSGRHLPEEWRGDLITNDFRAHRVCRFKLTETGSGYTSKQLPDLITSSDVAFRPVDVKMGPDGAIYIADFYNPIINHGEVDFRDPRRDHTHGRIWRVTAKGRPLVERPKLLGVSIPEVIEHLKDSEEWSRLHAKLVLREKPAAEVAPALAAWVKALDPKDPNVEANKLEALWAHESIDVPDAALLKELLAAKDAHVRAAAIRTLTHWLPQAPGAPQLLATAIADDAPQVRLEAVRALGAIPSTDSIIQATRALDKPMDVYLDYALFLTSRELEPVWMPALKEGKLAGWNNAKHVAWALRAVNSPDAIQYLVAQLKAGQVPASSRQSVFDLIAQSGSPEDLAVVFEQAVGPTPDVGALQALDRAARQRRSPAAALDRILPLFDSKEEKVAVAAVRLAGAFKLANTRPALEKLFTASGTSQPLRIAAAASLADFGKPSVAFFRSKSASPTEYPVRMAAIAGLAALDLKEASARAAELLATAPAGTDPGPILAAFLDREGGPEALTAALKQPKAAKLSPDLAKLSLRFLQASGRIDGGLLDLFHDASGLADTAMPLTPEQMKQAMADADAQGDAARGEKIFRSQATSCYTCHAINGAGGQVGPDLGTIGASAPLDYIIESVLLPQKQVKDGYHAYMISTKGGDIFSGVKVREDGSNVVLRDNLHDEIIVPVNTIKKQRDIGSLMPTGLADPLTHGEFLDLVKFLSSLGKPGPYGQSSALVVRRWRAIDSSASALSPGAPVYSLVSGILPLEAIAPAAEVRAEFETPAAGKVRVLLNSAKGLSVKLDGQPLDAKEETTPEVSAGTHTLSFHIDLAARNGDGLRLELADAPGSAAHAQPISGK